MGRLRKTDFETLSLFVILGVLTLMLVFGIRWVLFVPDSSRPLQPAAEIEARTR